MIKCCALRFCAVATAAAFTQAQTNVTYAWMFNCSVDIPYAHNVVLETINSSSSGLVAAAFQAGSTEGGDMHLRFTTSADDGASWSKSSVAVPSLDARSAWGPVLKSDGSSLFLFYALSRTATANFSNPGGDLFYQTSDDLGTSWSTGMRILTVEAFDGNPKYFVNQLVVLPSGEWLIPFGTTGAGYPRTAGAAGLLISTDTAHSKWTLLQPRFEIPTAHYISSILEPALALAKTDSLTFCILLFRTAEGFLYEATSTDVTCRNWTLPAATTLMNPNSRPSLAWSTRTRSLYLASNPENAGISRWPDWGDRSLLSLQRSVDAGESWYTLAQLEPEGVVSHCYPSVVIHKQSLLVAYSVYNTSIPRIGIKLARVMA